ncbi:MAG: glycosyltransferase [Pseudomonadota bacterium]
MNLCPKVSLVLCTKNRAEQLKACLTSINNIQSNFSWELIIVDNNSEDHTQQVIDTFKCHTSIPVQATIETIRGSSAAKNTGCKLAKGEYIAFTDDDCYPQADFVNSIVAVLDENKELGFVGGKVLLFDPQDIPITIQTHNSKIELKSSSYLAAGVIHGANFAFRRTALLATGGFDERFGAGKKYPCEDVDIMAEVLRLGWQGVYDPRVVVFHHHKRKLQSDAVSLSKQYDKGRGAYFAKRLLKPGTRKTYVKAWLRKIRLQSISTSMREILAALEFWIENSMKKSTSRNILNINIAE